MLGILWQAMAAESEALRPALVAAGAVTILTNLLVSGEGSGSHNEITS